MPARSCDRVTLPGPPAASSIKAAMGAAWGAAADDPQKLEKPGVAVRTQVAAVQCRVSATVFPPVEEKFPGVMGVPSGSKKIRRGPSELEGADRFRPVEDTSGPTRAPDVDGSNRDRVLRRRVADRIAGRCNSPNVLPMVSKRR